MPLTADNTRSLIHGAPRIRRAGGRVMLRQSRLIGWSLLALFGILPGLAAYARYGARPAELLREAATLSGLALAMAGLMLLLIVLLAAYGAFWVLWRREFDIDTGQRRWSFVSGIGPWAKRLSGSNDAAFALHLIRKRMSASRSDGAGGQLPFGGPTRESWELRLAIPGGREPLFLGEWGEESEARAEIDAWRRLLPAAGVVEEGKSP